MSLYRKLEGGELKRAREIFPDMECAQIHLNEDTESPWVFIYETSGFKHVSYSGPITNEDVHYIKTGIRSRKDFL